MTGRRPLCSIPRCRCWCRSHERCRPLPVHSCQGPRRRDRVGQEPAPDADDLRACCRRQPDDALASRRSRSICSRGCSAATSARRAAPAGSTSTTSFWTPSTCSRATTTPLRRSARKSWFSVDEYQDTNPLQERLLELWLGERRDVCVVGDEDQTIYTFTGATSTFLTGFAERHPGAHVVTSRRTTGRRPRCSSSPIGCSPRPGGRRGLVPRNRAARADDRPPRNGVRELTALTAWVRDRPGTAPSEIAVLVR